MALPKKTKKVVPDIGDAVQRAVKRTESGQTPQPSKGGRPSPRKGNSVRLTLLLSEETEERLALAYASERIKRRKLGEKLDKSLFIEEMIVAWLGDKDY